MSIQIFQNIVFSALGYGGWIGLAIVPFTWPRASTPGRRLLLLFLTPPTFAFLMTAFVSLFYAISLFSYNVFAVMSNPLFVQSMCSSIALTITTISGTIVSLHIAESYLGYSLLKDVKEPEVHSEEETEDEDTEGEETEGEETEGEDTEGEETEGEDTEGEDADVDEEETEEEDAVVDTTPLREAPPLPESDSDESVDEMDKKNA
jgi:hypothetical protein